MKVNVLAMVYWTINQALNYNDYFGKVCIGVNLFILIVAKLPGDRTELTPNLCNIVFTFFSFVGF